MSTPDMKDVLAEAYVGAALYASLHLDEPGEAGDFELVDVERVPIVWSPGVDLGERVSDPVAFTGIPDGSILTHVGIWSADTGGTFLDSFANNVTVDGNYTIILRYVQT